MNIYGAPDKTVLLLSWPPPDSALSLSHRQNRQHCEDKVFFKCLQYNQACPAETKAPEDAG